MNDKLKKVQDDDLSIIELDNRCDMSVIDPTLALVLFETSPNQFGCNPNSMCNIMSCNTGTGC